jgi:hypothetical protein
MINFGIILLRNFNDKPRTIIPIFVLKKPNNFITSSPFLLNDIPFTSFTTPLA